MGRFRALREAECAMVVPRVIARLLTPERLARTQCTIGEVATTVTFERGRMWP